MSNTNNIDKSPSSAPSNSISNCDTSDPLTELPTCSKDSPVCTLNNFEGETPLIDNEEDSLYQSLKNDSCLEGDFSFATPNTFDVSDDTSNLSSDKKRKGRPRKNIKLEEIGSTSTPFSIPLKDQINEISRSFREQPGPPYRCPLCLKVYFSYSGVIHHVRNNTHSEAAILENRKKMARHRRKPKAGGEGQNFAEVEIESELYRLSFDNSIFLEVADIPPSTPTQSPKKSKISNPKQVSPAKNSPKTLRGQYSPDKGPPPDATFKLVSERDHIKQGVTIPLNYIQYIEKTPEDQAAYVEYEMDEEDMAWLSLVNDKRKEDELSPITFDTFELIMDKFEKMCVFETSAEGVPTNPIPFDPLNNIDENAVCSICSDGEAQNTNMILFCDMCNIPVHQECYGVPYIPEGQWLCRRCQLSPSCGVDCVLCPNKSGAFKQTDDGRWTHVICALWIPEVQFANPVFLEPIDGIKNIPPARWKLLCYICGKKGPCIQCSRQNCYVAFHVSCAQDDSLYMRIEALDEVGGTLRKLAYCVNHGPEGVLRGGRRKKLAKMSETDTDDHENDTHKEDEEKKEVEEDKNGGSIKEAKPPRVKKQLAVPLPLPTISIPKVPDSKIKEIALKVEFPDTEVIIAKMNYYWMLKRHMRNGVPLIRRLAAGTQQKLSHQDLSSEELSELKEKFFLLRRVRTDLEKVRMLVQLTYKRERVKRDRAKAVYQSLELELAPLHRLMSLVIDMLSERDIAGIFTQPVNIEEVPDYTDVVKEPIDISTVRERLDSFDYHNLEMFSKDIYKIWENAKSYNPEDSVYTRAARRMENFTDILIEWLDNKSREINIDPKTGLLKKNPLSRTEGKPADEYLKLSPDEQVRQLQDKLDETRAILSSATTRKALVRSLREQIGKLVSEYGLKDVNLEHKFSESDSVATDPGREKSGKKRSRAETDTPSDIKSSLRMTASRRAALSSARQQSQEDAKRTPPPSPKSNSPSPKRAKQDSIADKEDSGTENLPSSQDTVVTTVSSDKGSSRSNSSRKKRKRGYYYRLSHEKPKRTTPRKRHSPEHYSETETEQEPALPPATSTPEALSLDMSRSFIDGPRTRSMSQTIELLPPLMSHPDPHLIIRQKVTLDPSFFSLKPPASPSISPCGDSTPQLSSEESENGPLRVTRQRVKEDQLPAIPEKEPLELSILTGSKYFQTNDSKSDDLENNYQSCDFHHLDLVWAKSAGYPSYPAIIVDPKQAKQSNKLRDIPIPKKEVLADKSAKPDFLLVNFFDSKRTWQWLPPSKLIFLGEEETDESKMKEVKGSHLKLSVSEAYQKASQFSAKKHSFQNSN